MSRPPWVARASLILLLAIVSPRSVALARAPDVAAAPQPPTLTAEKDLYLEVIVNETPVGLIAAFRQRPDGALAITPEELSEIGLVGRSGTTAADGLYDLDRIPCLTYLYSSVTQEIRIRAGDACRRAKSYSLAPGQDRGAWLTDTATSGVVTNYALYASTYSDVHGFDRFGKNDPTASLALDTWAFGQWGTLSQTGTVTSNESTLYDSVRLDTRWSFSDQSSLVTYSAGDVISGGLAWTRPVRLGGLQVQRDFTLRPDLVTMPMPSLSGSAAVPSTVDVYTNNVRVFSQPVPAGPFEINNVPVITGAGMARVVVHDALGRDTVADIPYYASSSLLRGGLYDFSLEAGFPRTYYGSLSNSYVGDPAMSATLRYGYADWLTLEAHAEGTDGLLNAGAGLVVPVGGIGLASAAAAGSAADGDGGLELAAGLELRSGLMSFNVRGQRALGDYADLASVTAPSHDDLSVGDFGVPEQLLQGVVSFASPFDPTTLTFSYTALDTRALEHDIIGASLTRPVLDRASLFLSASFDVGEADEGIVYAGLSTPLGPRLSSNASVTASNGRTAAGFDVVKSEGGAPGSYGWRLREREGSNPERLAAISYRGTAGRVEARAQQFGDTVLVSAELDGALAVVDGGVFVTDSMSDGFAVVDTGTPNTEVFVENRPAGRTNSDGKLLVGKLNAYQPNTIAIDPKSLPLDAEIPSTKEVVVPAARRGATARFAITPSAPSALVVLTGADGKVLPAGLRVALEGGADDFVLGYDGEVFLRGLARENGVRVELADGGTCSARFAFAPAAGEQVVIPAVCR